jgi:sortase A
MRRSDARLLLFVSAFLIFAGGVHLLLDNYYASALPVPEESLLASPPIQTEERRIPRNLRISSVNIQAPVIPVGLTKEGLMEAPEGPDNTGWFVLGVAPGEQGSSVIAGHRGFRTGPAVFDNLHLVQTGDEVEIETADGNKLTFVVTRKEVYGATEKVPEVWDRNDGRYLNLITCSGKWNRLTGTSDDRLVVFTKLKT